MCAPRMIWYTVTKPVSMHLLARRRLQSVSEILQVIRRRHSEMNETVDTVRILQRVAEIQRQIDETLRELDAID